MGFYLYVVSTDRILTHFSNMNSILPTTSPPPAEHHSPVGHTIQSRAQQTPSFPHWRCCTRPCSWNRTSRPELRTRRRWYFHCIAGGQRGRSGCTGRAAQGSRKWCGLLPECPGYSESYGHSVRLIASRPPIRADQIGLMRTTISLLD